MEASTARVRGTYVPALAKPSVRAAKVKFIINTTTCAESVCVYVCFRAFILLPMHREQRRDKDKDGDRAVGRWGGGAVGRGGGGGGVILCTWYG